MFRGFSFIYIINITVQYCAKLERSLQTPKTSENDLMLTSKIHHFSLRAPRNYTRTGTNKYDNPSILHMTLPFHIFRIGSAIKLSIQLLQRVSEWLK